MFGDSDRDRERMIRAILRVLANEPRPAGSTVVARQLRVRGIHMSDRTVRYHMKLMDERGLTKLVSRGVGRVITATGLEELGKGPVEYKLGLAISRIALLSYQTTFDLRTGTGLVPMNITLFPRQLIPHALEAMAKAFDVGLSVGNMVAVLAPGQRVGDIMVPKDKAGLCTICSVAFNGCLLKAGIPVESRFGGLLEMRDHEPDRFVELMEYSGTSMNPSEIFIKGRMTSVTSTVLTGNGRICATFVEVPAVSRGNVDDLVNVMDRWGINRVLSIGEGEEPVCGVSVGANKVGIALSTGLNPVAAAVESGRDGSSQAMAGLMEYQSLSPFKDMLKEYRLR